MNNLLFSFKNSQTIIFNRWTRKSYGIFCSIKRVVNIGVLTGTISLLAAPENNYAQTDTIKINKHLDIDEVLVSANRTQKMYSEVSRIMTVIPASEICNSAAQSINELLKTIPGIDIRNRGSHGVQSDISLRGGTFEQTLILINGIPVNDPQTGHHNLNIPINIENIERIEVLYGPGARVYGPNAFTGAVNIITNNYGANKIQAQIGLGQYGLFESNAALQITKKEQTHFLSMGTKTSNGYQPNTDLKAYQLFYRGTLFTKPGQFSFQAGYLNKAFGAQDFYTLDFPEQFEQIRQTSTALSFKKEITNLTLTANVHWKQNQDRFELFREDTYQYQNGLFITNQNDTAKFYPGIYQSWNYYKNHNYHLSQVSGFNLNTEYQSFLGRTAVGFEYRFDKIYSNVLGTPIDSMPAPNENHGFFTKSASRNNLNFFAEHSYSHNQFDITAGVLFHSNKQYNSKITSGIELSYALPNKIRLFSSINQGLRLPTFTDLYYDGPGNIGNPNLKPEEATTYEIGVKRYQPMLSWQSAIFYRKTTNAIDWVKYPSEVEYTTTNFSELETLGADIFFRIDPSKQNSKKQLIKYITGSYSFVNVNVQKKDSSVSAYALDYLKHKITVSTSIEITKGLGLNITASYNSRNGDFEDVNDNNVNYKPYLLMDSRIYYKHSFYEVYLDVNNLLNNNYMDIGGIKQAGLWIKGGIKINLTIKE